MAPQYHGWYFSPIVLRLLTFLGDVHNAYRGGAGTGIGDPRHTRVYCTSAVYFRVAQPAVYSKPFFVVFIQYDRPRLRKKIIYYGNDFSNEKERKKSNFMADGDTANVCTQIIHSHFGQFTSVRHIVSRRHFD